jgi:hypothetical protein
MFNCDCSFPLLFLLLVTSTLCGAPSEFWSGVLPLACKSSCERYFRTLDQPDKDCAEFCAPLVKMLNADENVQQALALSSAAYGLNLMQWSMRDVVMAVAERQPFEAMPMIFVTRLEFYEAELENSQDPEVRRTADKVRRAQQTQDDAAQQPAAKPRKPAAAPELQHDDTAFVDTEL